jgi:hypothetical protein
MSENLTPYFGAQALHTKEASHDSFDEDKFRNWLENNAGLGIYAHGRIHQEIGHTIYVSDLIHKRGHLMSSDILLMEEQNLLSMGEPLSTNSRLGDLKAMAVLPAMNSANGEGVLVAYYEHGVVSFNTFEVPRETRHDGKGTVIQKGWDTKRLVNHMLNSVSATGRYAVAVLQRDHLFRSTKGLHFLSIMAGVETFRSENVNKLSSDVEPLLAADTNLQGAACGFWFRGDRMFATTGLSMSYDHSSGSFGKGFVSWNQAFTFTDDRTPIAIWEGLWLPDPGIAGIHCFIDHTEDPSEDGFRFIASDKGGEVYVSKINSLSTVDLRDAVEIPIEWELITGQIAPSGLMSKNSCLGLAMEVLGGQTFSKLLVECRTDACLEWQRWHLVEAPPKPLTEGQKILFTESFGKPPKKCAEFTWIQIRLTGIGEMELRLLQLDFSPTVIKDGRKQSYVVDTPKDDYFRLNNQPFEERWPSA